MTGGGRHDERACETLCWGKHPGPMNEITISWTSNPLTQAHDSCQAELFVAKDIIPEGGGKEEAKPILSGKRILFC